MRLYKRGILEYDFMKKRVDTRGKVCYFNTERCRRQ